MGVACSMHRVDKKRIRNLAGKAETTWKT